MVSIFYISAVITVLASIKVISGRQSINVLLYFVVSIFATAILFFVMGAYFSVVLVIILFAGAVSLLFLVVLSLLNLRKDIVEQGQHGISPKIWLGPLILAFILFVALVHGITSTDYSLLQVNRVEDVGVKDMLLGAYILVVELAVLLLLGALVIAYHFIHRIYTNID